MSPRLEAVTGIVLIALMMFFAGFVAGGLWRGYVARPAVVSSGCDFADAPLWDAGR